MFRYLDAQGRQRELANEAELEAAIADGRVKAATPFTQDDQQWTIASRHPAFQRYSKTTRPPTSTADSGEYSQLKRTAVATVGVLLIIFVVQSAARREQKKMMTALTDQMAGKPNPASILTNPPRWQRAKTVWVVMRASKDAEEHMIEALRSQGLAGAPPEWMAPHYLRRPSSYPHIGRYFEALDRFYVVYADSLLPITIAALRRRATEAELKDRNLNGLILDVRRTEEETRTYFSAQSQWASQGSRIHNILLSAERNGGVRARGDEVEFANEFLARTYDAAAAQMERLEARIDTLEKRMQENNRKDLEKLAGA